MQISEKEYEAKLNEYLNEHGPNPGTTFFGSWGWYATKRNELNAIMKEEGIVVIPSK